MRTVGIIANPVSGKDVRRLLANAPTSTVQEKYTIVRRLVIGAAELGVQRFCFLTEPHRICLRAIETLHLEGVTYHQVPNAGRFDESDTTSTAAAMADLGCEVLVVLGGDGTNRAVALGWRDAPVIALSTGTNNVFPQFVEATVAGQAAGLVAGGHLALEDVATPSKVVEVTIVDAHDGQVDTDLALVDAVLVEEAMVGSRALFAPATLRSAVLSRAEPASVGMSAVGGLLHPCGATDPGGVVVHFEAGRAAAQRLRAPLAPGWYAEVGLREVRALAEGEAVVMSGPGILAFDGERRRLLGADQQAICTVAHRGPRVIDVTRAMHLAAERGVFARAT